MITKKKKREELQYLRDEALQVYQNRPDFRYDANEDVLYRHYKDRYTQLGQKAMTDTMGQAAVLTGGYGSSYAQNVGQQAYQSYLRQSGDVIPVLYQLAYDRYRDKGNDLYKTYQSWAQLEQQAAQQERWAEQQALRQEQWAAQQKQWAAQQAALQEQWEAEQAAQQDRWAAQQALQREQWNREYELAKRKQQEANRRQQLEQERKNSQPQTGTAQPDYWAMLSYHQKLGQNTQRKETAAAPGYDNGNVSEGNIKTMQRVLGLQETGKWTEKEHQKAGSLNADDAWLSYQRGQLQNRNSHGQWEQGATVGNIKTMERVLGLEEDGYWSSEDKKAAGGQTAFSAWKDYQQGRLQSRAGSGMSMDEWAELKKEQSTASGFSMTQTSDVREFIGRMMTKEQAAQRGITSKEWEAMVIDRLNHVKLSPVEFHQLETHYGLELKGGTSNTIGTDGASAQKMTYAEYRENTAPQKIDDLNAEVAKYFRDYQAFAYSAAYDSQHVGYHNVTFMLESRIRTAADLRKRADALLSSLETSGDIISGDYSELLDQISSTREGVDRIMDVFGKQENYYSRWDTEGAYQEALAARKDYEELLSFDIDAGQKEIDDLTAEYEALDWTDYAQRQKMYEYEKLISEKKAYLNRAKRLRKGIQFASMVSNDDFEYYSALGAAIQNPSVTDAEGYFNFWGWRPFAEEVGNIVTYSRDNYDHIAAMSEGGKYDIVGDLRYKDMTDDEVAIYNYLLAKEGKERAGEYLSYIEEDLNARIGKKTADLITSIDIPVVEELATGLYGLGAGVDQWISGTKQLFTNKQMPATITQYANSEIMDSLNGIGKYAYTGANAIGNMAPSILLSYVTAGLGAPVAVAKGVGAAAVGVSVAGNAYGSALKDGYSIGQARAYSTLVGAAEATLQYLLGGIGALGGITDDLIKVKINMIDNSLLRIGAKLGVDGAFEVTEEELQNFLEPAFRSIIFGEEYDAPTIHEMLETAVVTGITTLVLGGGDTISADLRENGHLNATIQMADTQVNTAATQEEVAKNLMSKGVSSKKADGIAEAIIARLNGQELTRTQRELLSFELGSPTVQSVISEFIQKKSNGVDSPQNRMYDERNISEGLITEENAAGWNFPNQSADAFRNHDHISATENSTHHQSQNAFSEGIRGIGADTVTYRRVQGGGGYNTSQVRIKVNADGSSSIPNKEANLSISIDGGEHAQYFLNKRGGDAQIIEIDVPKWFDDFLQENAIPQVNYKSNPRNQGGAAPKITDITTPGNCFELPAPWIEWLEEYGRNARIVNP